MSSQSAELDSAAMAGPIQAGGHYATPTPLGTGSGCSLTVPGWYLAHSRREGDPRGRGEGACHDDCGSWASCVDSQGLPRAEHVEEESRVREAETMGWGGLSQQDSPVMLS